MKPLYLMFVGALALALLAVAVPRDAAAQQEEVEQLLNEVGGSMRSIEQLLARASLEPEDIGALLRQLRRYAEEDEIDRLPTTLREFLLHNPDLLADLNRPGLEGEERREHQDAVRRLLARDAEGLEALLNRNPAILDGLLEQEDALQESLRSHTRRENDLRDLFAETGSTMRSTEDAIERLIELAHQMQAQGGPGQPGAQPGDQPGDQPGTGGPQPGAPPTTEYQPGGSRPDSVSEDGSEVDPSAWDLPGLPEREQERATAAWNENLPEGYKSEASAYSRLLARANRELREAADRAGEPGGAGASGPDAPETPATPEAGTEPDPTPAEPSPAEEPAGGNG